MAAFVKSEWKFENLTEEQVATVKELAGRQQWPSVTNILQAAGTLPRTLCNTCGNTSVVKAWTEWAIREKVI